MNISELPITTTPLHVLMVCQGNTCRSPLAAAMLRERLSEVPQLRSCQVDSAGLDVTAGSGVSDGARLVGLELGLDLSSHQTRQITSSLLAESDVILTMTWQQKTQIQSLGAAHRSYTIMEFAGLQNDDIDDPAGGSLDHYRATAESIASALDGIASRLHGMIR